MVEEWWSSVRKVDCVWVTYILSTGFLHKFKRVARWQGGKGARRCGVKEHERSSAGEEGGDW